jgi:hypothetical protein
MPPSSAGSIAANTVVNSTVTTPSRWKIGVVIDRIGQVGLTWHRMGCQRRQRMNRTARKPTITVGDNNPCRV